MAQRKKPQPADDLTALIALMPGWAGVDLAAVFYLVLHAASAQQVVLATQPGKVKERFAFKATRLPRSAAVVLMARSTSSLLGLVQRGLSALESGRGQTRRALLCQAAGAGRGRMKWHFW